MHSCFGPVFSCRLQRYGSEQTSRTTVQTTPATSGCSDAVDRLLTKRRSFDYASARHAKDAGLSRTGANRHVQIPRSQKTLPRDDNSLSRGGSAQDANQEFLNRNANRWADNLKPTTGYWQLPYSVLLNSAVAIVIITNAATVRYSRSMRIATKPASFSSIALNPCTE